MATAALTPEEINEDYDPETERELHTILDINYDRQFIGRGTIGKVLKIEHKTTKKVMALKLQWLKADKCTYMPVILKRNFLALFEFDSKYIIKLVTAYQFGKRNYYIFMEYVPNKDIYHWMYSSDKGVGALDINCVRFFSAQLVKALEYLRTENFVHRDIKTDNILLDEHFNIKMSEFGTSRMTDQEPGVVVFLRDMEKESRSGRTSHYAEEMFFKKEITFSTDLWCLGLLIFEMYCGKPMDGLFTDEFMAMPKEDKHHAAHRHYDAIAMQLYEYPYPKADAHLKELVHLLTIRDPKQRLGADDLRQLQQHPFFQGIPWDNMESLKSPGIVKNKESHISLSASASALKKSVGDKIDSAKASAKAKVESVKSKVESVKARAESFTDKAEAALAKKFYKEELPTLVSPPPEKEAVNPESDSDDGDELVIMGGNIVVKKGKKKPGHKTPQKDPASTKKPWDTPSPYKSPYKGQPLILKPETRRMLQEHNAAYQAQMEQLAKQGPRVRRWSINLEEMTSKYNYEIEEMVLSGRFAKYYKIADRKTGTFYSLKTYDKEIVDGYFQTRIQREWMTQKLLDSPYIIRVHKFFEDTERGYIVTDLAMKGDLYNAIHHITNSAGFEISCVQYYAAELVMALAYLRAAHWIHRDINIENIVFDSEWHLKLTDVWAATRPTLLTHGCHLKMKDHCGYNQDVLNDRKGECQPPEILYDEKPTYSTDLWALGLIMFEMHTGHAPMWLTEFDNKFMAEIKKSQREKYANAKEDVKKGDLRTLRSVENREFLKQWYTFIDEERYEYQVISPDPALKDLVHKLTRQDHNIRIGAKDIQEVQKHPFFQGIDWENLIDSEAPGIKPNSRLRDRGTISRRRQVRHADIFSGVDVSTPQALEAALRNVVSPPPDGNQ